MEDKWKTKESERAWEETLALWSHLAERPDEEVIGKPSEWLPKVLEELGICHTQKGKPFCEIYANTPNCPLGDCSVRWMPAPCWSRTPYYEWEREMTCNGWHRQEKARKFYNFLVEKKGG
ncbi:MAG: hypothetical protein DDT23_00037 [candidate division WS2 bacterium]|nr:hypothetical protein [Candidatus Lithacetigena glycinireducens]